MSPASARWAGRAGLVLWAVALFVIWTAPFVARFGTHALVDAERPTALVGKIGFATILAREWPELTPARVLTLPYRHANYTHLEWFLFTPVSVMLPFPVAFNLLVALVCVANALGCYALFRYLSGSPGIALGAACLGAWNPHTVEYIRQGHTDILAIFPLALYLLGLVRWLDGLEPGSPAPSRRLPWEAMGWLVATGLIYWYWVYLLMAVTALLVLQRGLAGRMDRRDLARLAGGLALVGLVLAPLALGMLVQNQGAERWRVRPPGRPFPSLEEARDPKAPYYGDYRIVRASVPVSRLADDAPVLALLLLGFLARPSRWRERWGWVAVALLFLVLSWGPYPTVLGGPEHPEEPAVRSPVYCAAYQVVPLFSRFHFPDRFRALYDLALAALVALVLADLLERSRPARAWLVGGALTVLLYGWALSTGRVVPNGSPRPALPFQTLDVAALRLRAGHPVEGPPGGILQLPFGTATAAAVDWSGVYQLLRGREVRSEWDAQPYNTTWREGPLPRSNSLLSQLADLSDPSAPKARPVRPEDLASTVDLLGFRSVAVDRAVFVRAWGERGHGLYEEAVRVLTGELGAPRSQWSTSALFEIPAPQREGRARE